VATPANVIQPLVAVVIHYALWMIPALLGLTALKLLFGAKLRGMEGEALVGRALAKLGLPALHDIVLPDGKGRLTQIDHVALTSQGFLVIETKNYSGLIFGTASERHWTQKLGRTTSRFQNPLHQNALHIKAVQALQLGAPVLGQVVFTNAARFPMGLPAGVSLLHSLREDLSEHLHAAPSEAINNAWQRLQQLASTDRAAKQAHRAELAHKYGPDLRRAIGRWLLGISVTLLVGFAFSGHIRNSRPHSQDQTGATTVPAARVSRDRAQSLHESDASPISRPAPRVVGYREEYVPGRPLEVCVGPDRELNEAVLRCRNGYTRKIPIYRR
jgi:hypothetical protein